MATNEATFNVCERCGATIYPEHLESHKADRLGGKLLCPHCLNEESRIMKAQNGAALAPDPEETPIALADDGGPVNDDASETRIKQFGGGGITFEQGQGKSAFQRPLDPESRNATRCRTFHAKLTDASLAHLNDLINAWVDENPDIRIKFVNSNVGVVEGKHADPHLILTVFY